MSVTVSPRNDSFKHLYYVACHFFGESLDTGLPALIHNRTAVRSNACAEKGADMGRRAANERKAPLRLTRRGRIVVFCFLLTFAGGLVALVSAPGQAADPPGPVPTIVVQPGDTLWDIASRTKGREGRDRTVEEIRRLNSLDGYDIDAGQRLILPRRR
ncbi:LysM peptidoglycan-binding domain-containing protein [Dactylosporangium sp. CA-233914]|uniref:LysM peptidoglycan-binding domain-containing protein n=1 Tax=Dactylosporangium sp. CA-233914 TaxID=3239934 RepID=UPI003D91FFED